MKQNHYRLSLILGSLLLAVSSTINVNAQEPKNANRSPGDGRRRPVEEPKPPALAERPSRDTIETPVYELRCRGGENAFQIEDAGVRRDDRGAQTSRSTAHVIFMKFNEAYGIARGDGTGLTPGTCSWTNRVLSASEPKMIRFEIRSIPESVVPIPTEGDSRNAVASFRRYMNNPSNYESFFVYQTPNGYFQATKHEHWSGRIDPSKVGIDDGKKRPFVVKP